MSEARAGGIRVQPSSIFMPLARGSSDAAGAWRSIQLFAAEYARPIVAGNGCDAAELREAQTRLGFSLPASTRTAYELIGRRRDLTSVPDRLEVVEIGRMLVFRWECHHVVEWGVPLSAVAEPDPPVAFRPGGGTVTWFETSGAIAREDPGTWLWVGAASPDGIAAVQRALPGEWSRNDE